MKSCAFSSPRKINEDVFLFFFCFLSDFLKEPRICISLRHIFCCPPLFFCSFSFLFFFWVPPKSPLKYSGASSSRHIFTFIVRDIKRSNYLISELWKHVCYEKTSKLGFNWCHFSRRWRGTYLFGTFFPLVKLHIHIPEWRWKFHFALFCHNWDAWCVPANWKTFHKHPRLIYSILMQLYCPQ